MADGDFPTSGAGLDYELGLRPAITLEYAPHDDVTENEDEETTQSGNRVYYQVGDII